MSGDTQHCDVIIAGGGLAGCLIALALAEKRPDLEVRIVEPDERLGGNHIWSFFDTDIAGDHRWLVEPIVCHRWIGYDVAFPAHRRTLDAAYNSIESKRLNAVVRQRIAPERITCAKVTSLDTRSVSLSNGDTVHANIIIDARGPGDMSALDLGWQKFVGLEINVPGGHGLERPMIMDATVDQIDGYRFVYCLPLDAETVFVEDTYYSNTPDLNVPAIRERIIAYAGKKGWHTNGGGREETGVLPVAYGGNFDAYWQSTGDHAAKAGLRAGLFNAMTGYSLPDAVRLAIAISQTPDLDIAAYSQRHWRQQGYFRMLGKMLFNAAKPEMRYRIFERFYRLSPGLIARFYSGRPSLYDMFRILCGKPPVPIGQAIRALFSGRK